MKKVITSVVALFIMGSVSFAQDAAKKAPAKKTVNKTAPAKATSSKAATSAKSVKASKAAVKK